MRRTIARPAEQGQSSAPLWAPASPGELLDRLAILELKLERLAQVDARQRVSREHALVRGVCARAGLLADERLHADVEELRRVNARLWEVEDALREHERQGRFDQAFVELARSVYQLNDRRARHKRAIDDRLGSALREEKSHAEVGRP